VYVTAAIPGSTKGNHYHRNMGEWFTVVAGKGWLDIRHPVSNEKTSISMGGSEPCTVYVPAGYAHSITNAGEDTLVCIAWAEKEHDPDDVYPFQVEPGPRSQSASTDGARTQG
jgi:UDP-2-acetamido-2,6-beta-L-arabino-hexul-4-ose reductase